MMDSMGFNDCLSFTQEFGTDCFCLVVDSGWRSSRLPSLARVILCLVRVVVPRLSWAVRYLDKLQGRAVLAG